MRPKKLEDSMLCNTDRRRLITKTFLAFSRTSKRRNGSKLSTNKIFLLYSEKFPGQKNF